MALVREAHRVAVEVRGGLVEEDHRGGGEQGAGQRQRDRWPAESPKPSSPSGVSRPWAGTRPRLRGPRPQRLPHGGGPGAGAQRQVGADGVGGEERPLPREVGGPGADLAALGGADAGEHLEQGGLARPDGPVSTVRPAPAVRSTRRGPGRQPPGRSSAVRARSPRRQEPRPGRRSRSPTRSRRRRGMRAWLRRPRPGRSGRLGGVSTSAAAPSAAEWNSAPTRLIGQYASGASRIATRPVPSAIEPCAAGCRR